MLRLAVNPLDKNADEASRSQTQHNRAKQPMTQRKETAEKKGELIALPAIPSFALGDANTILDIEIQADQLLNYINKLTSLADHACDTAIRQTETTQLIEENRHTEINDLRKKVDQQNEKLHEQQIALIRLEQQSKAQIAALERQLKHRETYRLEADELNVLRRENSDLGQHLNHAEEQAAKPSAKTVRESPASPSEETVELKRQLASKDEIIQAKNNGTKSLEIEFRAKVLELEQRLRDAQAELQKQEEKLKQKDTLIQATAVKEAEMGNLIKRLSAECDALSGELQSKRQAVAPSQSKASEPSAENKIWRRVMGRLQPDPQ